MALDVVDLRAFYASPLGRTARRFIWRIVRTRWEHCSGTSVLGLGYATPYLTAFRDEAVRVLAFMPAEQGVVHWPEQVVSSTALVETTMLPLPDSSIDRILVVHALELSEAPREVLSELWRILTPGGRLLIVVPNRASAWAQIESTPFAQGRPYSRAQIRELLRETLFSPVSQDEALYGPPFQRPLFLRMAGTLERIGGRLGLPGAGVLIVEATKQVYRPIGVRKVARAMPRLEPALISGPAGVVPRDPQAATGTAR